MHRSTTASTKRRNTVSPERSRMRVGQRLVQSVAQIPAQAEAVGHLPHAFTLGAHPLEAEDQEQLEEVHRVDTRPTDRGVSFPDQIADKSEFERAFQVAVDVVRQT
jgi:hypothetical protein